MIEAIIGATVALLYALPVGVAVIRFEHRLPPYFAPVAVLAPVMLLIAVSAYYLSP